MAKARVLAVDDQLYFRVFLEDLLSREGYEVATAEGGLAALRCLEREPFDVVLTDLVMPGVSGVALVERIKAQWPDQEVVVVTGVGDVQTAVDAMRRGASDYLIKPVEATLLTRSLESILQRRRLRHEHARLMAENLEYLGVLSVYERAFSLFATLGLEPLAERIVEGLCVETRAQGGVLWLLRSDEEQARLRIAAARGLVRVDREPEELSLEALPAALGELAAPRGAAFLCPEGDRAEPAAPPGALVVPLRCAGRLVGFARLTDKLAGASFDARDRAVAERFAEPAAQAVANALRFRRLERRSFRDPTTKAYTWAYFEDVVRNEVQKAGRFGRSFSLLKVEVDGLDRVRGRLGEHELDAWLEALAFQIARALRATDLIAVEGEARYALLLPETDALGAAVLKRRVREALEAGDRLRPGGVPKPLPLRVAAASFPVDGAHLDALERVLSRRIEEERRSLVGALALEGRAFADALDALAGRGEQRPSEIFEPILRFVVSEVERRAGERGVVCVAPGNGAMAAVVEGLARLHAGSTRTEVVLVSEVRPDALAGAPVTFVSPQRAHTARPFLIYYGEGPVYAVVSDGAPRGGRMRLFQSSDRVLIEHLAFQLQRELGVPIGR